MGPWCIYSGNLSVKLYGNVQLLGNIRKNEKTYIIYMYNIIDIYIWQFKAKFEFGYTNPKLLSTTGVHPLSICTRRG